MIITDGTHLVSTESLTELNKFAVHKLGFRQAWLQFGGLCRSIPHYDLTTDRARRRAINAGARRVTSQVLVQRAYRIPR